MIFGPIGSLAIGAVKSIGNTSPPPEYVVPVGSKLVIGASATGAFSGHDYEVAYRTGSSTWTFYTPSEGDVTATYRKGTKIRYKDGGAFEYGVVISSSYSAPNTTYAL